MIQRDSALTLFLLQPLEVLSRHPEPLLSSGLAAGSDPLLLVRLSSSGVPAEVHVLHADVRTSVRELLVSLLLALGRGRRRSSSAGRGTALGSWASSGRGRPSLRARRTARRRTLALGRVWLGEEGVGHSDQQAEGLLGMRRGRVGAVAVEESVEGGREGGVRSTFSNPSAGGVAGRGGARGRSSPSRSTPHDNVLPTTNTHPVSRSIHDSHQSTDIHLTVVSLAELSAIASSGPLRTSTLLTSRSVVRSTSPGPSISSKLTHPSLACLAQKLDDWLVGLEENPIDALYVAPFPSIASFWRGTLSSDELVPTWDHHPSPSNPCTPPSTPACPQSTDILALPFLLR